MKYIFFSAILFITSCASLNTVTSVVDSTDASDDLFRYGDTESKVRYYVTNDTEFLKVKFNTAESPSIAKILRTGLTIYFDVKGKKKKDVFVQYPLEQKVKLTQADMPKMSSSKSPTPMIDSGKLLSELTGLALFESYKEEKNFSVLDSKSDIKIAITANSNSEITYELIIPISRITNGGLNSLSNLSIGIVSGSFEAPAMGSGGGQGMSGGSGSMSDGGMRGSGGGGGQGGGQGRGRSTGGSQSGNSSIMTKPINIWFKVDLQ